MSAVGVSVALNRPSVLTSLYDVLKRRRVCGTNSGRPTLRLVSAELHLGRKLGVIVDSPKSGAGPLEKMYLDPGDGGV